MKRKIVGAISEGFAMTKAPNIALQPKLVPRTAELFVRAIKQKEMIGEIESDIFEICLGI